MSPLPEFTSIKDIRMGSDPAQEAWLHHFLTENNLEFLLSPGLVASPEQLRFMVALEDDQLYVPCSDELFRQFYQGEHSDDLQREYAKAWRFVGSLVHTYGISRAAKRRILHLCRYRFQLYLSSRMILPARLIKRLVGIVLAQTGVLDPFQERKRQANARMAEVITNPQFIRVLVACPHASKAATIPDRRWELDFLELTRLLRLSTHRMLWEGDVSPLTVEEELATACADCDCLHMVLGPESSPRKKILYIPDLAGGFIVDLAVIKSLLRQGHQVVLALKEAFYFNTPVIWDMDADPVLRASTEGMFFLHSEAVSKNELLQHLREHRLVVISDGTSEQLNLYRVSVTFARAWKECDLIMAKGRRNAHVLLGTSQDFTRDIVCFWRDEDGRYHMRCKPKAPWTRKFTETDLTARADEIVNAMHNARREGKSVMFYSAVIGSIPGQTQTAIQLVSTFVQHLRERMENTFIINPAEHFSEGMDGDDLMFMWERVQRSGFLDVWRFQTFDDIETSFALLNRKVPSVWLGKDATFSTGCTKEMQIALDVQRTHPELQIIGPAAEKFFRRREYGIGKYFDARL